MSNSENNNNNNQPNTTIQKKPGRPKKKMNNIIECINKGIINEPNSCEHKMELIYNDPKIFKKIFGMFKGYFVEDVFINFNLDNVYILTKDHTKKTIIKICINADKVSEYFCKEPFEICIKREYLEKIFSTIEKTHSKIVLFSTNNTYQSSLGVNLINDDSSVYDNYIIDLSLQNNTEDKNDIIHNINKSDYLISFRIKSKSFKKFINDTSCNGKLLTIEKIGNNHLQFKMSFNNKIQFTRTIVNEENYNLISKLDDEDLFNINIELEFVKPFSNLNISEFVDIYVDKNKKAIFDCNVNNGFANVTIYNEIVNLVNN